MNRRLGDEDFESFKNKYGFLRYVLGAVTECEELYYKWNSLFLKIVVSYIPFFILLVYASPYFFSKTVQEYITLAVLTVLPLAQKRYDTLLGMGGDVAFWYVSALAMSVPAIILCSISYIRVYAYCLVSGHNKSNADFVKYFGSFAYIIFSALFFYFFIFFPIPLDQKTSVPFVQLLFGPGFPVLMSGFAMTLFFVVGPVLAILVRIFVRNSGKS